MLQMQFYERKTPADDNTASQEKLLALNQLQLESVVGWDMVFRYDTHIDIQSTNGEWCLWERQWGASCVHSFSKKKSSTSCSFLLAPGPMVLLFSLDQLWCSSEPAQLINPAESQAVVFWAGNEDWPSQEPAKRREGWEPLPGEDDPSLATQTAPLPIQDQP